MAGNDLTNIEVYRKKLHFNIGIIIFGVIFIYLVVTILAYVTQKHVSVYEVREGSILRDNSYTGIVLREETVVYADTAGYVNYFVPEGYKVGMKTNVYSLSPEKLTFDTATQTSENEGTSEEAVLTSEEQAAAVMKAQTFCEGFQDTQYGDAYTLKDSVESIISSSSTQSREAQITAMLQDGQEGVTLYSAADDGIIIYSTDGYEGLTADQVTEDMISRADYQKNEPGNNTKVASGDPVYKLITSDDWTLVIELDDAMAKELAETTSVKVKFSKDHQVTRAGFSIYNTKESNLGFLTFDRSMVRYAGERFLDIELILVDASGLKIPKSAVVEKDFYLVPEEYITKGGNSSGSGVLIQGKKNTTEFRTVDIYYRDNETGMVYLNPTDFKEGTVLVKPDSSDSYVLNKTESLLGVYNINKGYAVFQQIHKLCESDEYYIVESGNTYGISNYDHIALEGKNVRENDVIF